MLILLLLYTRKAEQRRRDLYAVEVGSIWPDELLENKGTVVVHCLV